MLLIAWEVLSILSRDNALDLIEPCAGLSLLSRPAQMASPTLMV
jgi:hypothetical protein